MTEVGAIVLAAGQSSRFRAGGGLDVTKLVAKLDGKPIVRRVAEAALASGARPVVVVTGYAQSAVEAALADLDIAITFNSKFASGLASSLKAGLAATAPHVAGALVLLGDMPWIEPQLIDALIGAFLARKGALAAVPLREGRRGNPVLLGRGLFEAAMSLDRRRGGAAADRRAKPGRTCRSRGSRHERDPRYRHARRSGGGAAFRGGCSAAMQAHSSIA